MKKLCKRCETKKNLDEMVKNGQDKFGEQSYRYLCKVCNRDAEREKYHSDNEKVCKSMREPKHHHTCLTALHLKMARMAWICDTWREEV